MMYILMDMEWITMGTRVCPTQISALASAGIISIAAGMGAQRMAADLLAGFFMMLEGTVHMGDQVSIGNIKGKVTDMGIRTITITDAMGNISIINNSKATPICNMCRMQPSQETDK